MIKKVVLTFPGEAAEQPFTYTLVKEFDVQINILKASIEPGKAGTLFLELKSDKEANLDKAIAYLEKNGVGVCPIASRISYDDKNCVNCGNCAAACTSQSLSIEKPEWKLKFDPEKCILCKLCLKSCPLKLFSIEFSE